MIRMHINPQIKSVKPQWAQRNVFFFIPSGKSFYLKISRMVSTFTVDDIRDKIYRLPVLRKYCGVNTLGSHLSYFIGFLLPCTVQTVS